MVSVSGGEASGTVCVPGSPERPLLRPGDDEGIAEIARDSGQGVQALHLLLFVAGASLFVAGFVVIVAGLPAGAPIGPASPNSTAGAPTTTEVTTSPSATTTDTTDETTSSSASTTSATTARSTTTSTATTRTTTTPGTTSTATTTTGTTTTARGTVVDASILGFVTAQGSFSEGQIVTAQVLVENTGTTSHTFFVGYSVYGPDGVERHNGGTTGKAITLAPGERRTVTLEWRVESDAPAGPYDAQTVVWKEDDPAELQTQLDGVVIENAFYVEASTSTSTTGEDDD